MLKKLPFGIRFYVIGCISFLLGYMIFSVQLPLQVSEGQQELQSFFVLLVGLFYLSCLGLILKNRVRRYLIWLFVAAYAYHVYQLITTGLSLWQSGEYSGTSILPSLGLPLFISFAPPLFMYGMAWFKEGDLFNIYLSGLGGSGRFGTIRTFHKNPASLGLSLFLTGNAGVCSGTIFFGRSLFRHDPIPRLIGINDESHIISCCPAGTGKSVSSIYPVVSTYLGDIIIVDPKSEHSKQTFHRRCSKEYLEKRGIEIPEGVEYHLPNGEAMVLDPFGISGIHSSKYNPMSERDIHSENSREFIYALVDGLVLPQKEKYWEETPKDIIAGFITYVLDKFPDEPEKQTLPYVLDIFTGINDDGFADASEEALQELLFDMLTCNAAGGLAQQAAASILKMGEKERGSHFSTIARSLKWCGDPAMRKHLVTSDFSFSEIGTRVNEKGEVVKQTIYIVCPDTRMDDLKRWIRSLLAISSVALRKRKHHPQHRTLLIIDEFPLLEHMSTIAKGFGLFRGYHIKIWLLGQSLGHLKIHYKEYWTAMLAQSTCQVYGQPPTDLETLEFISKVLGSHNISMADVKGIGVKDAFNTHRPVLTPAEIALLIGKGKNKQILIPSGGGYPLLLERLTFKPMKIGGKRFRGLPLDGLRGHFPTNQKF
jgi:type IV secretion system protein VirD4